MKKLTIEQQKAIIENIVTCCFKQSHSNRRKQIITLKLTSMKKKIRFTTVALDKDQFLLPQYHASCVETYCLGYKNRFNPKRDRTLDGYYYTK